MLDHYGLHYIEGDIPILVQKDRVDHVLGVDITIDAEVAPNRRAGSHCPHLINLNDTAAGDLPDDPLVEFMLPFPKDVGEPAMFIEDTMINKAVARELLRLGSPISGPVCQPFWMFSPEQILTQLHSTNLLPLALYGLRPEHSMKLGKILEAAFYAPRRLLVIGPARTILREEIIRHQPKVLIEDLVGLDLERIGAGRLVNYMKDTTR